MQQRLSSRDIAARKGVTPIVCTTAYTAPMAGFMDAHVDLMLVGDSMGMVIYGMATTLGVTLEMAIAHGQAVMRGSSKACVVVDLPFGSYQASPVDAFKAAVQVHGEIQECHMVAGGFDYLLKTRIADMGAYRDFAGTVLWQLPGVRETRTYAVMEEVKNTTHLKLD